MNENEKEKENKNASETYSYEDVEEGEEGDLGEVSELEISVSEKSIPTSSRICPGVTTPPDVSDSVLGEDLIDSYEERKKLLLREKWLTMTGKKPRNIPNIRKYADEVQNVVFFGDQRPAEVEEKIREKMEKKYKEIIYHGIKYGKVLQEFPNLFFSNLVSARFLSDTDYFTTCYRSGEVQIRKSNTGEEIMQLDTIEGKDRLAVRSLRYSPENTDMLYVAGDAGIVQVFDSTTGECVATSDSYHEIYNTDFSVQGNYLAAVGHMGGVYFFDPSTLQIISSRGWPCGAEATMPGLEDSYHRLMVHALKAHPSQNNLFASAGTDYTMKIWDVRTIAAINSIRGPWVHGDGLDIFQDNNIITASWTVENSLNLWDFSSGKLIKQIPINTKSTKFDGEFLFTCKVFKNYSFDVSLNNNLVAVGGSGFQDALIINIETNEVVGYYPSFKAISCMDVQNNLMIYGGMESLIRIAEVEVKAKRKIRK